MSLEIPSQGDAKARDIQLRSEFEEELTKNNVVVEEPRQFSWNPIRYEKFGDASDKMQKYLGLVIDWLKKPYVTDQFGATAEGHTQRRAWKDIMYSKFGDQLGPEVERLFHGSKYSANSRGIMFGNLSLIISTLREIPEYVGLANQIEALKKMSPSFRGDRGRNLSLEELRSRTEKMEDLAYEIISLLSEFSKQEK
jgi:hypothetical protein